MVDKKSKEFLWIQKNKKKLGPPFLLPKMGLSFHDIKKKVQKRIGKQTVKKNVEFVEQKGINLWGLNKP